MNIDFLEQCYGTQVFWALEMLSVNVASATLNFSSVHLVYISFVSEKTKEQGMSHVTRPALVRHLKNKHGFIGK